MKLTEALIKIKRYEALLNQEFTYIKDGGKYIVKLITIVPVSFRNSVAYEFYSTSNSAYLETLINEDCIVLFVMNSGYDIPVYEDDIEYLFGIELEKLR